MARSHPATQRGRWSVGHISFMALLAVALLHGRPVAGPVCEVRVISQECLAAQEHPNARRARIPVTVALVDTALTGSLPAVLLHRSAEPHDILLLHTPEATPQLLSETLNGVRVVRSVVGEGHATELVLSPRFTKRQPAMGGAEAVLNRLRSSPQTELVSVGSVRQIVVYINDVGWKH
jgi:hypothetical protein